jgi:hypothetical protein
VIPERVVEILQEGKSRGSGYLITSKHVLTARHVPRPARIGASCNIRRLYLIGGQQPSLHANAQLRPATVGWASETHDLALIELDAAIDGLEAGPVELGKVPKDGRPRLCLASGFPEASGIEQRTLGGALSWVLTRTHRFDFDVTSGRPRDPRQWVGVSGAAIFVDQLLVAVLSRMDEAWDGRVLEATPSELLLDDAGLTDVLGRSGFSPPKCRDVGPGRLEALSAYVEAIHERACGDRSLPLDFDAEDAGISIAGTLRFSPRNPRVPFIGRKDELAALEEFTSVVRPRPFVWWLMTGGGGAGKTKLARQLCLHADMRGWRTGFLPNSFRPDLASLDRWSPKLPTFIVVDYVSKRASDVRTLMARLARRRDLPPVRLLLLEREREDLPGNDILGSSQSDRGEIEATSYARAPLVLPNLSADDLWSLVEQCPWRTDGERLKTPRDEFFARLDKLDSQRRALIAMILADALTMSPDRDDLGGLQEELSDLLRREREHHWPAKLDAASRPVGESEADVLIAFATIVDGLRPQDLEAIDKARGAQPFDRRIIPACAEAIGKPIDRQRPTLARLEPDLIGEFFVLETLHNRANPFAETAHRWMLKAAWRMRKRAMADFAVRAWQNFSAHPAIQDIASPVEGIKESWKVAIRDTIWRAGEWDEGVALVGKKLVEAANSDPRGAGMALAEWTADLMSFDVDTTIKIAYLRALGELSVAYKHTPHLRGWWEGNVQRFFDVHAEADRGDCWTLLLEFQQLAEGYQVAAFWEIWAAAALRFIRADAALAQQAGVERTAELGAP